MDAVVRPLFAGLSSKCPAFPVDASKLTFLSEPNEFYTQLNHMILRSKNRIVIAALYLGTDDQCMTLVNSLQQALQSSQTLRVCLLFDRMRATRSVPFAATQSPPSSPINDTDAEIPPSDIPSLSSIPNLEGDSNSLHVLSPLLHPQYMNRVSISLYQTPLLTSWFRTFVRSPRTQEIAGVQHLKVFIGDDDLILSGANLEKNYFTERQDRYIYIHHCKDLVNWYEKLVQVVCTFSYSATLHPSSSPKSNPSPRRNTELLTMSPPPCGFDPLTVPAKFNEYAYAQLQPLLHPASQPLTSSTSAELSGSQDTWIFPTIQMGSAGVTHDEEITKFIIKECSKCKEDNLYLSSPYFNITDCYCIPLLSSHSQAAVNVITAHPTANGFFTAKDISRYIPSLYLIASQWFMEKVMHQGHIHRIYLHEYRRPHWTYHAKGLWWIHAKSLVSLTMIGSPNFGYRSIHRDLESQVVILTQNQMLHSVFQSERNQLFRYAERIVDPRCRFQQPDLTNIPLWVKLFAPFAQKWL